MQHRLFFRKMSAYKMQVHSWHPYSILLSVLFNILLPSVLLSMVAFWTTLWLVKILQQPIRFFEINGWMNDNLPSFFTRFQGYISGLLWLPSSAWFFFNETPYFFHNQQPPQPQIQIASYLAAPMRVKPTPVTPTLLENFEGGGHCLQFFLYFWGAKSENCNPKTHI